MKVNFFQEENFMTLHDVTLDLSSDCAFKELVLSVFVCFSFFLIFVDLVKTYLLCK